MHRAAKESRHDRWPCRWLAIELVVTHRRWSTSHVRCSGRAERELPLLAFQRARAAPWNDNRTLLISHEKSGLVISLGEQTIPENNKPLLKQCSWSLAAFGFCPHFSCCSGSRGGIVVFRLCAVKHARGGVPGPRVDWEIPPRWRQLRAAAAVLVGDDMGIQ